MARYSFSFSLNTKKRPATWAIPDFPGIAKPVPVFNLVRQGFLSSSTQILPRNGTHGDSAPLFVSAGQGTSETRMRSRRPLRPGDRLKRVSDIAIASTSLVLLLPILILMAVLVRASGPGPIIFRQERIGADRKPFVLLKFRTMRPSAEFSQATVDDPRVTAIGRILRRLSFDEFVQLINVVKGEMSLVGPRPHAPETRVEGILFEEAVPSYRQRYAIKPGITGLAQIRGQRGETRTIQQLEERVASDIEYIENWSIWLDFHILFKTIPVIFKQVNAY